MKVSVLVENEVVSPNLLGLRGEHGLSLYIELEGLKILFDVGHTDLFARNAKQMGIHLEEVDYLILSHAHADHGGGLKTFLELNNKAPVYLHELARENYYSMRADAELHNIGLDQDVLAQYGERIHYVGSDLQLMEQIHLLTGFAHDFPLPMSNGSLYKDGVAGPVPDTFDHELVLLVNEGEGGRVVLFTACSHSGIINMMTKAEQFLGDQRLDMVFGGFHTHNRSRQTNETPAYLERLANQLLKHGAVYYTGHCTGHDNYLFLKERMGERLQEMHTGTSESL